MKFKQIKDHPETHRQLVDILPSVKDEKIVDLEYCGKNNKIAQSWQLFKSKKVA